MIVIAPALLALLLPTLILVAWHLERSDRRGEYREQLAAHERERERWTTERAELLNRIKPETAQYIHSGEIHVPPAVAMDDDPAFWESKEAMAERLAAEEMASA